ncbi:hypothetical protein RCO28_34515 [Streptomyces sp. LHD-70]|uniref:hypothetical protein n=1 Tax=Streptomyces sp. LHD-70 TaxID=3072140 RepID=UPI00280E18B6|nr:hypothetical protein [Streptomyces sp. LHD-70]MDQ8707547.1 hypothetical protein [Streptomyces sp. LHD-70]
MSGHDWTIDTIIHALPSPEMRQKALREVHLAPLHELDQIIAKWQRLAERWVTVDAPRIAEARAQLESAGTLPAEHQETLESAEQFDAWRDNMRALRRQSGAA